MKDIILLYANNRNPGDRESHLSISDYLKNLSVPHSSLCFESKEFELHLKNRKSNTLYIIGGGGLFRGFFIKMWMEVIGFDFIIWGVGINYEYSNLFDRMSTTSVKKILSHCKLAGLRDSCTYHISKNICNSYYTGCPSIVRTKMNFDRIIKNKRNDLVFASSPHFSISETEKRTIKSFCIRYNLNFLDIDHYSLTDMDKITKVYSSAILVVSPRLHSCIFAMSCCANFISWDYNPKVKYFFRDNNIETFLIKNIFLGRMFRNVTLKRMLENSIHANLNMCNKVNFIKNCNSTFFTKVCEIIL